MNEGTVLIRITRDLPSFFGTRSEDGRKLSFDLGEPREHTSKLEGEPVYEPVIHAEDDRAAWLVKMLDDPLFRSAVDAAFAAPGDFGPAKGYYGADTGHFLDMVRSELESGS